MELGNRDPGSGNQDQGTRDQKTLIWNRDQGSGIRGPGMRDQDQGMRDQGTKGLGDQGSETKIRDQGIGHLGSRIINLESGSQGSETRDQIIRESGYLGLGHCQLLYNLPRPQMLIYICDKRKKKVKKKKRKLSGRCHWRLSKHRRWLRRTRRRSSRGKLT